MQSPRALEGDAASLTWGIHSFSIHPLGKEDPNEKDATHCTAASAAYGMQYAKSHGGKASGRGAPGGAEEPSVSVNDPTDGTPEKPEADRPEVSKPETGKPEKPDAPTEPSSPAAPETAGERPSEEKETGGSPQQETFGGIQVVFDALPQTAGDIEALLEYYPLSDPRHTGAFFITSLVRYVDSADDGLAMIDVLRGPQPMNGMEQDFIKDRLRDKTYLPGAYFEGAAPENDYTPDTYPRHALDTDRL